MTASPASLSLSGLSSFLPPSFSCTCGFLSINLSIAFLNQFPLPFMPQSSIYLPGLRRFHSAGACPYSQSMCCWSSLMNVMLVSLTMLERSAHSCLTFFLRAGRCHRCHIAAHWSLMCGHLEAIQHQHEGERERERKKRAREDGRGRERKNMCMPEECV